MSTIPRQGAGQRRRAVSNGRPRNAADESKSDFASFLDGVQRTLQDESASDDAFRAAMDDLIIALRTRRFNSKPGEWREFVDQCRRHPVKQLLDQDPFTHRAYSKPRGYAGDAVLLDYIYGREELWPAPRASRIGRRIFSYTTHAPSTCGVRARRGFVAAMIDRLAEEARHPKILSMAAGHLREASLLATLKRRTLGRLVALDADEQSLREVEASYRCYGVETVLANVRRLLAGKVHLGQFDLIYSTGLFDYLGPASARRLMRRMFELLNPGGRLLVANFLPGVRDIGYMETFMDWPLVYRSRQEMVEITMEIPQEEIRDIRLFAEDSQNIIFAQVTRCG